MGARRHLVPVVDLAGWFAGHAHEIVLPLASTAEPLPAPMLPPRIAPVQVRTHGRLPGADGRILAKLYAHPDRHPELLTDHLTALLTDLAPGARWSFLRYHDPEPHLRLRLPAEGMAALAGWAQRLQHAGLIRSMQWDTDFPEAARYGGPAAHRAAEPVFAADSRAAVAQLRAAGLEHLDVQAVTAASMVDLATALIGDTTAAMRLLIARTRAHRPAPPRAVYDQAVALAQPGEQHARLGDAVADAWRERATALAGYREALTAAGIGPAVLLPDLLHLHHTRMAGADIDAERVCLHLARAAALSWTTRTGRRHP